MKNIDICIFKENGVFFIDLQKWKSISDIPIQIGDIFNFSKNDKKHLVKVVEINNTDAKLQSI